MIPFHKSIGFRLLGISFILLALPLLVDSFLFLENRFESASSFAQDNLLKQQNYRLLSIDEKTRHTEEVFSILIHFLGLQETFPDDNKAGLDEKLQQLSLLNHYQGIIIASVTDRGQGKYTTVGSSSKLYENQDVTTLFKPLAPFSTFALAQGSITGLTYDHFINSSIVMTVMPLYTEEGVPMGVIGIIVDHDVGIKELLRPSEIPYKINYAFLLPSGVIFAATDPSLVYQYTRKLDSKDHQYLSEIIPGAQNILPTKPINIVKAQDPRFILFDWHDIRQLGSVRPIPGTEIGLLAYADKEAILSPVKSEFILIYGTYLAVLICGLIISFFITKRMAKPISKLSTVMNKIQDGELSKRYKSDLFGFEINRLGEIFNSMVESLIEREQLVEKQRVEKETISKELRVGQSVQRELLPRHTPKYEGLDIGHAYVPAIEVGGDFFDLFVKPNGKLVASVADASGKGVRACLYSLTLKNMLRTVAQSDDNVHEAMRRANNLLCEDTGDTGMFVTVFMSQYDHKTGLFEYNSCGHNPVLRYCAETENCEFLDSDEMAMGVLESTKEAKSKVVSLKSGDIVVLYSDGVTEAHNLKKELFGEDRLKRYIRIEANRSARELTDGLMEELQIFAKGAKQHDDITLVILKVK